jgi:UDPglucose 6-dehydrogenase/GDP-mannose 6-dehydrogenase
MQVAIVGAGYVGLVSGVCLAAKGHRVVCVDVAQDVVDRLNRAEPPIHERGLDTLLRTVRASRCFRATTRLADALDGADIAIIAVGTPSDGGVIDLRFVRKVARDIGHWLRDQDRFLPVVVKSTVVPGTTDTVVRQEIEAASGQRFGAFGLGMNPEFLREGEAIEDFLDPDRIVLGHDDTRTLAALEELYEPWTCDKLRVNTRTAELIKYANNALLATQISAINELANLAAAAGGIDIMEVVQGVRLDRRWSTMENGRRVFPAILDYLVPGCGFGGSCFPKDVQAVQAHGRALGLPMQMMAAVLAVNDDQPGQVVDILCAEEPHMAGKTCLVLGLAFKPGTDDVRESASLKIVALLLLRGARVVLHDPVAADRFASALGADAAAVAFVEDWQAQLPRADIIVVATKWPEYRALATAALAGKILFDARRMFEPAELPGARYLSVGRRVG